MVLFTREEIRRMRDRLPEHPSVLKDLYARCENAVRHGIRIQKSGLGTWPLYFACPDCAANLTFDYTNEFEYTCPKCGKVVTGEPYRGGWWAGVNFIIITRYTAVFPTITPDGWMRRRWTTPTISRIWPVRTT